MEILSLRQESLLFSGRHWQMGGGSFHSAGIFQHLSNRFDAVSRNSQQHEHTVAVSCNSQHLTRAGDAGCCELLLPVAAAC